jgi:Prophage antirepressor
MEKDNAIQVYSFQDQPVRIVDINGEHWWVAADVCEVLGHTNPTMALERLDDDERSKLNLGRQGETNIINEPGLYSLIMGSRKPEARAFKRWVTHSVLPALNRKGFYVNGQERGEENTARTLLKTVTRLEARIASLEEALSGNKYRAAMLESASRRVREELPSAPPFFKNRLLPGEPLLRRRGAGVRRRAHQEH